MAKVIIMIHNVQEYVIGFSFIAVVCCNHKMSGGYFKFYATKHTRGRKGVLVVDIVIDHS